MKTAPTGLVAWCVAIVFSISPCSARTSAAENDKNQRHILNFCFSVIRKNGNKVRVVVKPFTRLSLSAGSRDLRVGSRFWLIEKDFGYTYSVQAITTTGLKVGYKGHNFGESEEVAGFVMLRWKP